MAPIKEIFAFRTRTVLTRPYWQAILVTMVEMCSAGYLRRTEVLIGYNVGGQWRAGINKTHHLWIYTWLCWKPFYG